MRQWMIDPEVMCRNHLLGEHVEHHMFIGSLKKGVSIEGFLKNNLLEPLSLEARHDALVVEMTRRGYNHNSPLSDISVIESLTDDQLNWEIDRASSIEALLSRCPDCMAAFKQKYQQ